MTAAATTPNELAEVGSHELAQRAHSGCAVAFDELAKRYRPRLLTALQRRLSGSLSDAEDVAQETLARAWEKIQQYDRQYQFSTWLYTIAFRLAVDHQRRHKKRRNDVSLVDNSEPADSGRFVRRVEEQDEAVSLWAIAQQVLNESQYTVMWLRYGKDLDLDEVARRTGRTKVGTRVLLHRARKALQRHAAPRMQEENKEATL